MSNPYTPIPVIIEDIVMENEAKDLKTFRLAFEKGEDRNSFSFMPGQFAEISIAGLGEAPFGIASSPTEQEYLLFTVKKMGTLTSELHNADRLRRIGVRGPFGRPFPWDRMEGKNILVVSGGFAFTTLRAALVYMLDGRKRGCFGDITVVYGAREPGELLYKDLFLEWKKRKDASVILTVDQAKGEDWDGKVGVVPKIVQDLKPDPFNTIALVCGPPIMIKYTIPVLILLGFGKEDIIISLENRMKCGIGKCGRCNIGPKYVCIDGPVFAYSELEKLPQEY